MYGGSPPQSDRAPWGSAGFQRDLRAARDTRHELRNSLFAIEVGLASLAATDDEGDRRQLTRSLQQEAGRARALSEELSAPIISAVEDIPRQPGHE